MHNTMMIFATKEDNINEDKTIKLSPVWTLILDEFRCKEPQLDAKMKKQGICDVLPGITISATKFTLVKVNRISWSLYQKMLVT